MQYHFKTNHAVMVGQGRQPLSSAISSAENLTAEESQLRKEKRQIGGVVVGGHFLEEKRLAENLKPLILDSTAGDDLRS